MQWNPEILREFIAPGITKFTSADIPDLTKRFPQAPYWVTNHFLNNALRASFKDQWRQVVMACWRRSKTDHLCRLKIDQGFSGAAYYTASD
jgi:hypothetical protein